MKILSTAALALSLGLSAGAHAYGVSPKQYSQGQAADQQQQPAAVQPGGMLGSAPQPSTYSAPAPGQAPAVQVAPQAAASQNFDAYVPDDWAKEWKHYHFNDAKALWESKQAVFIDARAKVEYDQGHIPGAVPMPLGEFDKYYDQYKAKLKKAKFLITYCHGVGCKLSDKVAQKLYQDKGMKNTGAFFGGWPQWQQHNMPVETGPEPKSR
jgi:rhodanese-related sulfurtransferase